ncbi:hypothetical protein TRIATDRAFT_257807 [Trichoderma atroviride IMI 206040]|uniref:Uncharacterized protein n=1 Tax=Hypocrea atroviridis (strain ATCC 20476 / IMI 206040) TaxID=452589 RepID=G9P0C4_HYPAI|nr:uncharacterized protein TRIATDRAFT_257807 [Trichoderma atroviride IMI 206040]EHK44167.1 hypothetical protein TRIATDRAFT_257807 [Trichoderma atroviride IMI 206040]
MLQQNGDCSVGCSLHRCDAGPCNAKEKRKEGIVGAVSELLASSSCARECGILNACPPTSMPAHTCNRNGYI